MQGVPGAGLATAVSKTQWCLHNLQVWRGATPGTRQLGVGAVTGEGDWAQSTLASPHSPPAAGKSRHSLDGFSGSQVLTGWTSLLDQMFPGNFIDISLSERGTGSQNPGGLESMARQISWASERSYQHLYPPPRPSMHIGGLLGGPEAQEPSICRSQSFRGRDKAQGPLMQPLCVTP